MGGFVGGGGAASGGGGLILLEQHTASNSASLNFTTRNGTGLSGATFQADYDVYQICVVNVVPATSGSTFQLRWSTNGGSTYDGTSVYDGVLTITYVGVGSGSGGSVNQTSINMGNISNDANYGVCGSFTLFSPSSAAYKLLMLEFLMKDATQGLLRGLSGYAYRNLTAVNAFQVNFSSGNIASGTVRVYGVAKS